MLLVSWINTIREKTDGCSEQYHCATSLLIIYCLLHPPNVIIGRDIFVTVHERDVVDVINTVDKRFLIDTMREKNDQSKG